MNVSSAQKEKPVNSSHDEKNPTKMTTAKV